LDGTRITGPLRTWYDLHEALAHETQALSQLATELTSENLGTYCERFDLFANELRTHSEVEDSLMFPAVRSRGGIVDTELSIQHRQEQLASYELGCALIRARALQDESSLEAVGPTADALRNALLAHLDWEDTQVLSQVSGLFGDDEQAHMLQTIFAAVPSDPHLQAWVAGALTPEHLEARLRNLAATLDGAKLSATMSQIRAGVEPGTWQTIEARTPDLAALAPA
jgi:hemerythrin-like domain-containing protein